MLPDKLNRNILDRGFAEKDNKISISSTIISSDLLLLSSLLFFFKNNNSIHRGLLKMVPSGLHPLFNKNNKSSTTFSLFVYISCDVHLLYRLVIKYVNKV